MKIGLLQCDHVAERFQHIAGDYPEMFGALFQQYAPQHRLVPFDVCNGAWPASLDACDAYLCTGSRWSVYDEIEWIHTLKQFVQQLRDAGKPFVGICFGHQLLAEALGGQVAKAEAGWGVGVHAVEITRAEPWMQPPQASPRLHYMHQDQVLHLPDRAVVLGRSAHCPVAVMRLSSSMLGIQAHPEFTAAYSQALLHDRRARIGAERTEAALNSLQQPTDETLVTRWIARFLEQTQHD
jgi:GMP synthase-like glutamine amidotransferase